MVRIQGEIVIDRPIDEVFDFAVDERNEPSYNPRIFAVEKLTWASLKHVLEGRQNLIANAPPSGAVLPSQLERLPALSAHHHARAGQPAGTNLRRH
jgi:hypothetical protein